jgi:hypothetical protein
MIPQDAVYITDSDLGRAVYSRLLFAPGDLVLEVAGDVITDPEHSSDYCMDLGHGRVLEPHEPCRLLNHSCEPNCELFILDGEPPQMALYAKSTIQPGDELTIDYGWEADHAIPCLCGARSCRGWIVAEDQLSLLPSRA